MIYSSTRKPEGQVLATQSGSGQGGSGLRAAQEMSTKNSYEIDSYEMNSLSDQELPNAGESLAFVGTQAEALAERILHRIATRLPCRVRRLQVLVTEGEVILEGECSTYYTKQIAQHTAMGVLEYEQLVNHIVVCAAK